MFICPIGFFSLVVVIEILDTTIDLTCRCITSIHLFSTHRFNILVEYDQYLGMLLIKFPPKIDTMMFVFF